MSKNVMGTIKFKVFIVLVFLSSLVVSQFCKSTPIATAASNLTNNSIILPADGRVTVNFIGVGGPGDWTRCTGDFGLSEPQNMLIYENYLYFAAVPFSIANSFPKGTELVFYLSVAGGSICNQNTYLSTDPSRAIITQPKPNVWRIGWEDWFDNDFNDLVVEVVFEPTVIPFLDLPFDYKGSTFAFQSRDTEQGGTIDAYFDHQYPTYCESPNIDGCSASDQRAVNFYGYDGGSTENQPPYRVVYNGHNGIDFEGDNIPILAAAEGDIIFKGPIETTCKDGTIKTANVIKIKHKNGYTTEYWHLSSFGPGAQTPTVGRDLARPIGFSGSTGCVTGPHLHFLTRNPEGIVVDPFGWKPKHDAAWYGKEDPWQAYQASKKSAQATSHYLWLHPLEQAALIDPNNGTVFMSPAGDLTVNFPENVFDQPLRIELAETLQSTEIPGYLSTRTFSLSGFTRDNVVVEVLQKVFTLIINQGSQSIQGTNSQRHTASTVPPKLYFWNQDTSSWEPVQTTWDPKTGDMEATSTRLGTYTLAEPSPLYLPFVTVP